MQNRLFLTATLLMLTGWGCTSSSETATNIDNQKLMADGPTYLTINQQVVTNGVLIIEKAQFAQDVWVVVQADNNGQPGRVLARSTYSGWAISDLRLTLEAGANSPLLHVSVHADNGSKGVYEPESADSALHYGTLPVKNTVHVTYEGTSTAAPVGETATTPTNPAENVVELNLDANL